VEERWGESRFALWKVVTPLDKGRNGVDLASHRKSVRAYAAGEME